MSRQNQWLFETPLAQASSDHANLEYETPLEQEWEISAANYYNVPLTEDEWEALPSIRRVGRTSGIPRRNSKQTTSNRRRQGQNSSNTANPPVRETVSGFSRYSNSVRSLPPQEQQKINQIARLIVNSYGPGQQPIRVVHLIGHADKDTPRRPEFEKKISGDRALAVQKALMSSINQQRPRLAAQITWHMTKAGASQLIVPNPVTEQERLRNRRVEILLGTRAKGGTVDPNRPPDIPQIQACLNRILGTRLVTDGTMEPKTHTAIRSFQQRQGLPVSGMLTPQTLTALSQSCSLPIPPSDELTGILVMTVFSNGASTNECNIEVFIDGKPVSAAPSQFGLVFPIPSHPRPLPIRISAKPTTGKHWELVGNFQYQVNRQLEAIGDTPPEFLRESLSPLILPDGQPVLPLTIVLSRVRDATQEVKQALREKKPAYPPWVRPHVPATWDTPKRENINFIAPTPKSPTGDLQFEQKTVDPDTEDLVLEVKGVEAPKLIAVSWPKRVLRDSSSAPTPFLIYFRPTLVQNVHQKFGGLREGAVEESFYVGEKNGESLGKYPLGWDFLAFGMWAFLNYTGDPLTRSFTYGLPYQTDVSGKDVVLILPCNKFPGVRGLGELGEFMNAAFVQEILQEIQAFMFRRGLNKSFSSPPLGKVALAAFSSGNTFITQFLVKNQKHPFCRYNLKEVYMFDPPRSEKTRSLVKLIKQVNTWLSPDKIVRAYTQEKHPEYSSLRVFAPSQQSVTVLPTKAWMKARSDRGISPPADPLDQYYIAHQLIASMMLTDALRQSGF